MAKIAFENGRISNFEGLVTLALTLDRVILHTVVHHSSTSTYMSNFIEIKETFCGCMLRIPDPKILKDNSLPCFSGVTKTCRTAATVQALCCN